MESDLELLNVKSDDDGSVVPLETEEDEESARSTMSSPRASKRGFLSPIRSPAAAVQNGHSASATAAAHATATTAAAAVATTDSAAIGANVVADDEADVDDGGAADDEDDDSDSGPTKQKRMASQPLLQSYERKAESEFRGVPLVDVADDEDGGTKVEGSGLKRGEAKDSKGEQTEAAGAGQGGGSAEHGGGGIWGINLDGVSTVSSISQHFIAAAQWLKPSFSSLKYSLVAFDDVPEWLRDNQFIRTGYRVNLSWKACLVSIFKLHNETFNIWTHLLGFILFFLLWIVTLSSLLSGPTVGDMVLFSVFLLGAQVQMLFSTLFHVFCCNSASSFKWLARLDYSGISVMIVGSYFPPMYYAFTCTPVWRWVYLVMISLFGVVGVVMGMTPVFGRPNMKVLRAAFFLTFGFSAVIPIPHLMLLRGFLFAWPLAWREAIMGFFYTLGAVVYATRYPEVKYPGKFDLVNSHVLWHFCTIIAALLQLYTCVFSYHYYKNLPCTIT